MLELSSLLPAAPVVPGRPQLLAAASAESFAVALNALVLPGAVPGKPGEIAVEGKLPGGKHSPAMRQGSAEPGKILPVEPGLEVTGDDAAEPLLAAGNDDGAAEPDADPALAWLTPDAPAPVVASAPITPVAVPVAPVAEVPVAKAIVADSVTQVPAAAPALVEDQPTTDTPLPASITPDLADPRAAAPVELSAKAANDAAAPVPGTPIVDTKPAAAGEPRRRNTARAADGAAPSPATARKRAGEKSVEVQASPIEPNQAAADTPAPLRRVHRSATGEQAKAPANDTDASVTPSVSPAIAAAPPVATGVQPAAPQVASAPAAVTQIATPVRADRAVEAFVQPQPAGARVEGAPIAPTPPVDAEIIAALRPEMLSTPATPQPVAQGEVRTTAAPAPQPAFTAPAPNVAQALADAAPALVQLALEPAPRRFRLADAAQFTLIAPAQGAPMPQLVPIAAPSADQQPTLDTRRQEWTGQMIDLIETMRDEAPVKETRMRLAPEALGNVEISVRRDGDRVHVHFTADTPAARQMLADAQPRLAELAESRGLKLGQTSVEGGAAGQSGAGSHAQRQEAETRQASRPASARTPQDTEEKPSAADDRIA